MLEELKGRMTLAEVGEEVGKSLSTVDRWTTYGVRGRKLRSIMVGGRRYVLPSDLDIFLQQGAEEKMPPAATYPSPTAAAGNDRASNELERRFGL